MSSSGVSNCRWWPNMTPREEKMNHFDQQIRLRYNRWGLETPRRWEGCQLPEMWFLFDDCFIQEIWLRKKFCGRRHRNPRQGLWPANLCWMTRGRATTWNGFAFLRFQKVIRQSDEERSRGLTNQLFHRFFDRFSLRLWSQMDRRYSSDAVSAIRGFIWWRNHGDRSDLLISDIIGKSKTLLSRFMVLYVPTPKNHHGEAPRDLCCVAIGNIE